MATAFRILGREHGVPQDHIQALERRFGRHFPVKVEGAVDAMTWLVSVLPWGQLHPVLRTWLDRAYARAGGDVHADIRARRVLRLLVDEPDEHACAARIGELKELLQTYQRVRGLPEGPLGMLTTHKGVCVEMRAYAAGYAAAVVASAAVNHDEASMVHYTIALIGWVTSQYGVEDDEVGLSAEFDVMVKELVNAVASWIGSFVWTRREAEA